MKLTNEARVGLLTTVSFTIFIVLVAVLAGVSVNKSGYELKIYYGFLNDLRVGAPVKIAGGIRIGQVTSISQSGEKSMVTVWIDNQYKLIKTSQFAIFTSGMIGEKYVNVFVPPATNVEEFLQNGDKVYGIDPASLDQMMLTFQSFMQDQSGGEILADIVQNTKKFVENLNNIAAENRQDIRTSILNIRQIAVKLQRDIKVITYQLERTTRNVADLTEQNKAEINITLKNLSEISSNLNKIIFRLEQGRGTLGKLLVEEDIYNNLKDASVYAKDLFKVLKQNPSKLFFQQKNR